MQCVIQNLLDEIHHKNFSLCGNMITAEGSSIICSILRESGSKIATLSLQNNQLNDDCVYSLGEYIKDNKCIRNICIDSNKITDHGICILSSLMEGNTTLQRLSISGNKDISDKSISPLIKLIQNTHLEDVNMEYTSATRENVIVSHLAKNILKCGYNKMNFFNR